MIAGIRIRPAKESDIPHVMKTWLDGYRSSRWARSALQSLYYPTHRLIVEAILARAELLVACSATDEDTIAGWACAEPRRGLLHFVHVKPSMRGGGIARTLVESCGETIRTASHSLERLPDGWTFDSTKMFFNPRKETNE